MKSLRQLSNVTLWTMLVMFCLLGYSISQVASNHARLELLYTTSGMSIADQTRSDTLQQAQPSIPSAQAFSELQLQHQRWIRLVIMMASITALSSLISLWYTRYWVNQRLGAEPHVLVKRVKQMSTGDLTVSINNDSRRNDSVMATLGQMQKSLCRSVASVRRGAESVASSSSQIANSNSQLSHRTQRQASALEGTASSIVQVGVTAELNAQHAQQANTLTRTANDIATDGREIVDKVVVSMKGIHDSSRQIANIINIIDDIAFQTNLLALNAAVESARAGEQGRGFAVVAGEVRSLAQRSAQAADEIKALINSSVGHAESGAKLVDVAGTTMSEMVVSISQVTSIMGGISNASAEQSTGVAKVGAAINDIDAAVQKNALLVRESALAASSLDAQAKHLLDAVALFRIDGGTDD